MILAAVFFCRRIWENYMFYHIKSFYAVRTCFINYSPKSNFEF